MLREVRDGSVLRLTLARPERRNALDANLIAELTRSFRSVGDARAVVLAGEGESFCAGGDIEWMRASVDLPFDDNLADARRLEELLDVVDSCPAPVIARVQGHAFGGACGLLACSDVVLAAPDAQFAFSEVKLGLIPAVISRYALARIGAGNARRYFVTGERFDATVALGIGLVHELTEDLDRSVESVLAEILAGGPEAVRAAKELARGTHGDEPSRLLAERRASAEGQEGLHAFLEKRPPSWRD